MIRRAFETVIKRQCESIDRPNIHVFFPFTLITISLLFPLSPQLTYYFSRAIRIHLCLLYFIVFWNME